MAKSPKEIRVGINKLRAYLGTEYEKWNGVWPPNQPIFYSDAPPEPAPSTVRAQGILCSGALNLWEQIMGIDPGGTQTAMGTLAWEKYLVNKRPYRAGMKLPVGTVVGFEFARNQDGHVVVVSTEPDENGVQWTIGADVPLGLNEKRTLAGAHKVFNFTYVGEDPKIGTIPLGQDPTPAGKTDNEKARVIDQYFERMDYYPHVEYRPLGDLAIEICREHTGPPELALWVSTLATQWEKEGGGKHIFGGDWGTLRKDVVPFAHMEVNKERFDKLVAHVRRGGQSNGVSLGQVTYHVYLDELARMAGGGHLMRNAAIKGANILNDLLNKNPKNYLGALEAYNDGSVANNPANRYELDFAAMHLDWKARLN